MASGARKNHLSVMMVHAPVGMVQVAKRDRGGLKLCDPGTGEPLKQVYVNEKTGEQFTKGQCGRAIELSKGVYKQMPEDAMAAINGGGRVESIDIEGTRPIEDLPLHRIRDSHYMQPEGGSVKALGLIWSGLYATARYALAKASVGTSQRMVAIVPIEGGALAALTLRFADEVVQPDEDILAVGAITHELSEVERKHAEQLMVALDDSEDFQDTARDTGKAQLLELIEKVMADEKLPTVGEAPDVVATPAPDLDKMITEGLRELKARKKSKPKKKKAVTA